MRETGLEPSAWTGLPGDRFEDHVHDYDKVVVAVEGSITFGLTGFGVGIVIAAGERVDMPSRVRHNAMVGPRGAVCLEAHLPPGTLGSFVKGRGYRW